MGFFVLSRVPESEQEHETCLSHPFRGHADLLHFVSWIRLRLARRIGARLRYLFGNSVMVTRVRCGLHRTRLLSSDQRQHPTWICPQPNNEPSSC